MPNEIDTDKLAALLKQRRGRLGLRAAAEQIGNVSASTLSRIEQGSLPDLDTFMRICRWLSVSPSFFMVGAPEEEDEHDAQELPVTEQIAVHLRADRTLDPKTIDAIITMVRLAYAAAERDELEGEEA